MTAKAREERLRRLGVMEGRSSDDEEEDVVSKRVVKRVVSGVKTARVPLLQAPRQAPVEEQRKKLKVGGVAKVGEVGKVKAALADRIPKPRPRDLTPRGLLATSHTHSIDIVKAEGDKYVPYLDWGDNAAVDSVSLLYPSGKSEMFSLLSPRKDNEYRPLDELVATVETICNWIPDDRRSPFAVAQDGNSIVRNLQRAKNVKDGVRLVRTIERFNTELARLVDDGAWVDVVKKWSSLPRDIGNLTLYQVHNRIVGPEADRLNKYVPWTDNVYGELSAKFIHRLIHSDPDLARLLDNEDALFLDMGCGTGHCVLQVVLEKGCRGVGIEQMELAASLGKAQARELEARTALLGYGVPTAEIVHGDFLNDSRERCARLIAEASVILINNYAFSPATNEAIKSMLLDCRTGCQILSLAPFFLTKARPGSVDACFAVSMRQYISGEVSWTDRGGDYYLSRRRG